jgi:hypothetical protein
MFDLNARVHFDEVVATFLIEEKLHRSGIVVLHPSRDRYCGFSHFGPEPGRQDEGGSDLDQLLMPSLDRAVAFTQVDDVAVSIGQNLEFNVMGALDILLNEHAAITERGQGFSPGDLDVLAKFGI